MPMSNRFRSRLEERLPTIRRYFGTPCFVYDEAGILESYHRLQTAFSGLPGYRNYYAIKACPIKGVLRLLFEAGSGFDCSSPIELKKARALGAQSEKIIFTSNNTSDAELTTWRATGGILNLDDISLVFRVPEPFPEQICFRYNPGPRRQLESVMGNPGKAKYGAPHEQIVKAYGLAIERGAKRFGLHTMVVSNERDYRCMVETAKMLLDVAEMINGELGITFEFINIGGGFGIPYQPEHQPIDMDRMAAEIAGLFQLFGDKNGYQPKFYTECGRFVTGPHAALVLTCINRKDGYCKFVGVDASATASVMRPVMYHNPDHPERGWHQISVTGKFQEPASEVVSVVGAVCEDGERFGWDRELPRIEIGDTLFFEDAGAHCRAMSMPYNGRGCPQSVLLRADGSLELIERAQTDEDLVATETFEPKIVKP